MVNALASSSSQSRAADHIERRFPRHELGLWCEVDVEEHLFHGLIADISLGGARLRNVVVAPGEELTLHVVLPEAEGFDSSHVTIAATVVWARGGEAGILFSAGRCNAVGVLTAMLAADTSSTLQ